MLLHGLAGYFASGGNGANVGLASTTARPGLQNNYLSHTEALDREIAKRELAACLESDACSDEKVAGLKATVETLDSIDANRDGFLRESCQNDPRGANCIAAVRELAFTLELFKNPQDPFGIGSTVDQIVLTYTNAQILANSGVFQTGSDGALTLTGMVSERDQGMVLFGTYSESWGVVQAERGTEHALNLINTTMQILELGGVAALSRGGVVARPAYPIKGTVAQANFAQIRARPNKAFSREGISKYSQIAGVEIRTVQDLTDALRSGQISAAQIPVDYVIIRGQPVIANTRTSTALMNAGIPMDQWVGVNRTGQQLFPGFGRTFDDNVNNQINNNASPIDPADWR